MAAGAVQFLEAVPIKKRFWFPHPYARPYLWRNVTIGHELQINGNVLGGWDGTKPLPPIPDAFLQWDGKDQGKPKPEIIWVVKKEGGHHIE